MARECCMSDVENGNAPDSEKKDNEDPFDNDL